MSDLISRSALIEEVGKIETNFYFDQYGKYNPVLKTMKILNCIEDAPTLEAIQVVHCRECEHWGKIKHPAQTERVKVCGWGRYFTGENGYCVYGEKVE